MRNRIVASLTMVVGLGIAGCGSSGSGSSSTSASASGASSTTSSIAASTTATSAASSGAASTNSTSSGAASTNAASTSNSVTGSSGTNSTSGSVTGSTGSNGTNVATASGTNSSSSTVSGSSGTSGSGASTGSSGGSSGSTAGQINSNCGPEAEVCAPGQLCQQFPAIQNVSAAYYTCACNPFTVLDDGGFQDDSCGDYLFNTLVADGGGGNASICDQNLYTCRQPMDYDLINQFAQTDADLCAPGYRPIYSPIGYPDGGQSGTLPAADGGVLTSLPDGGEIPDFADGGLSIECFQSCDTNGSADCTANYTTCAFAALGELLPDAGILDGGSICQQNLCGPDDLEIYTSDGGFVLDADGGLYYPNGTAYYGACNGHGVGDGVCDPIPESSTSYIGLCWVPGTAVSGAACNGLFAQVAGANGGPGSCVAGDLCFGEFGAPAPQGSQYPTNICLEMCNTNSGQSGPMTTCPNNAMGTAETCHTLYNSEPIGTDTGAGFCE